MNTITNKNWLKCFFIFSTLLVLLFITFNFIIDPYGFNNQFTLFDINKNKTQTEAQSRKFKIRLAEQREFNGLFLGSSEMTFLGNTDYMTENSGKIFFNLAFNEQEIYESYQYLKYFIDNGKKIEHIIYGLTPLKFNKNSPNYRQDLPKNITSFLNDIITYLSFNTFIDSIKTIYKNLNNFPTIYNNNGWKIVNIFKYHNIALEDQKTWIESRINLIPINIVAEAKNFKLDMQKVDYLFEMIEYCDKNNIKLDILFMPMYSKHFDAMNQYIANDISQLKYLIAQKKSFYDFSWKNDINQDSMNFIDQVSHPQQKVSIPILETVLYNSGTNKFGYYVTKENVVEFNKMVLLNTKKAI